VAGKAPDDLVAPVARLTELAEEAGKTAPVIIAMKTLPLEDIDAAIELVGAYEEVGVDEVVHADGYPDADAYRRRIELLATRVIPSIDA